VTAPIMIRTVQFPASKSVLLPQGVRLFSNFPIMFIDELNLTTSPKPAYRFGKVNEYE
jgi:hypothetical protein